MIVKQISKQVIDLLSSITIGGLYEHYKGKHYKVIAVSRNVDDLSWWVIYEALYHNSVSKIWHRKIEDFVQVGRWIENQPERPRFMLVENVSNNYLI
ncbi:MAG: DUF1653 domain-containing protein [Candidatus Babeliaceae bacterium]